MAKFTSVLPFPLGTKSLSGGFGLFPFSSDWSIAATSCQAHYDDFQKFRENSALNCVHH